MVFEAADLPHYFTVRLERRAEYETSYRRSFKILHSEHRKEAGVARGAPRRTSRVVAWLTA